MSAKDLIYSNTGVTSMRQPEPKSYLILCKGLISSNTGVTSMRQPKRSSFLQ
jgi:hypothetical protein